MTTSSPGVRAETAPPAGSAPGSPEPSSGERRAVAEATAAGLPPVDRPVRPISLRRHVRVTFGVAVLVSIIIAVTSVLGFWALLDAREEIVDRADPALLSSSELLAGLVDQETGVRAFVLAADPRFLAPYEEGEARYAADREEVERLGAEFEGVTEALVDVDAAVADWRSGYVEPTLAGVEAGDPSVRDEAMLDEGRARFDVIRAAVARLQSDLTVARENARQELSTTTTRLVVALAVSALVLVGLVVFLWRLIRLGVEGPLHRLGQDARQVSGGDLGHPVAPVGPIELQALGAAMEQMRHRIVDELEAVKDARDQLADQTEDLARSNAELEQFAYVASHDLQEPLRKVASFCQLLQSRYEGRLDDRADQYIGFAVDGAKRMQALINDLLEFSRVGRRGGEPVLADADVLVGRALSNLSDTVEETGAHITVEDLPLVRVEVSLGVALFQNLLSNALKFRREGTEPQVAVTVRRDGDHHEFAVTDDGIGIAPDYAERIFVIFQRLHGKDEYAGTGIGLALCRKIVEHHGGRIWVDTSRYVPGEEHGTTVRFTLPAVQGDA